MLRQFVIQNGDGYTLPYPAAKWEEGMLFGSGKTGAVAMGAAGTETVILTHEKLFAPVREKRMPIPMAEKLPQIREMIADGKPEDASALIVEMYKNQEHRDEKIWTNAFHPAANLTIETSGCGIYGGYERSLVFASGEGHVHFQADEKIHERRYFMSRTENCLFILLKSSGDSDYRVSLSRTPYTKNGKMIHDDVFFENPDKDFFQGKLSEKDGVMIYICRYNGTDRGYFVTLSFPAEDALPPIRHHMAELKDKRNCLVAVSVIPFTDSDYDDILASEIKKHAGLKRRGESSDTIYQLYFDKHKKVHEERFNRIKLSLENKHLETMFNAGRYEILSSCGDTPPNLQGIWTGTYDVPWSSDYTQNGNLQTAVMGMLPCGDAEGMDSLFGYEESLLDDFRLNSQMLYGCRGIHIPSRTSDWGTDFHFDMTWPMLFWTAGAAWIAHFYYDYWLYTCDNEFFVSKALPFMEEAALFYEDFLVKDEHGKWKFTPSYSPENTPANRKNAACENATMDISVAKELFHNLITGCKTLGIEQEKVAKWQKILDDMPPYLINEDGALKEWASPDIEDHYDHRHASHLYMLYYDLPQYEPKEVLDAAKKAYEIKMDRKKEQVGTMAFGLIQAGMAAAHLGDAVMAEELLSEIAKNDYYRTYASSHDYGPEIFNTDICGGIPAFMLECLAQSSPLTNSDGKISAYKIRLLPALPASMSTGQVSGLYLRGGFILDMKWENGTILSYTIDNPQNKQYCLDL